MDENLYTGCVMINLKPKMGFEWNDHLAKCDKNDVIELEHDLHVTVMYGINRNELKKLELMSIYHSIQNIQLEKDFTYFVPERKCEVVAKYDVCKSCIGYLQLLIARQHIFKTCRVIETYPNYNPHATYGYFKSKISNIELPSTDFVVSNITTSYKNDAGELISTKLFETELLAQLHNATIKKSQLLGESKLINAGDSVKNDAAKNKFIDLISSNNIDTVFGDKIKGKSIDEEYNKKINVLLMAYKNVIDYLEKEGAITVRGYKIQKNY